MASILLLDSSAATARRTSRLLNSAGHAVRTTGDVARMLQTPAGAPFLIVVRDHAESPVDPSMVRRLQSVPHAGGLLVLAPAVRWVAWVGMADRVLPEGISGDLLLDAIRKILDPAPAMVGASRATPGPADIADIAVSADPVDAALPGVGIAGYRMLKLIGRGGMSVVYLAAHEASGEHRVLKLLPISEHDGGVLVQRLINEAALLAQLRHPGIVRIHEQGCSEWHAYIAMEYLPGGELTALLGQPLPPPYVIEIVLQIAEALGAIHGAGMVHRDLKPANILRRADGTFVLADFGIARKKGVDLSRSGPGHLVGTAAYLAPETIDSGRIDHRSDLYAVGVLFHEMLTGHKPFEAPGALEVMDLHLHAPVPRLASALGWAQPLVDGLLAKRPEDRFASADSLINAVLRAVTELQTLASGWSAAFATQPPGVTQMQDSRTVAVVGFNATELLVLGSVFGLAAKRIPRFVRHIDPATQPDLFLADADDASAVAELVWRNADRRLPVVLVGESDHGTGWLVLPRPLQWANVIVAFDHAIRATAPATPAPTPLPLMSRRAKRTEPDTILIVGSDRGFNALVFDRLSRHSVAIEDVPDLDAALERLANGRYPCVIIDGDARGVESLRLCKAIKSRKGHQPTAVIIASSGTEQFERVRATMAGCDAFLAKPLSDRKLDDAIQRYVAAAAAY